MKVNEKSFLFYKRFNWMLALLALSLAMTGCSQSGDLSEGKELREVTLVLDWVPNTNHTGFYVADQLGYFSDEGLKVSIIQPTQGGSTELVAAGQGEFGISYQEQITYARTARDPLPVTAIAAIIQHNTSGFASAAEKNILRPRDFEGMTYGGWGSPVEDAMLELLMKSDGGDYAELSTTNIGTLDFFDAVTNHVDFTWIYYGWDGVAAELNGFDINFILLQEYGEVLNFYTPVLMTSEKLIEEDPELIASFLRASSRGYSFAMEHPEEAASILLEEVPELDHDIVVASQIYLADQYQADAERWGEMKLEVWLNYADWMYQEGLLENPLDANKAFTNQFIP